MFSISPTTGKEKLIQELLLEVEKRYALQPSQTLISKISGVFDKLPEAALVEWIGMLKVLPSEHPEWQSFVEGLTVHETYFCRDRNVLNGIKDFILPYLFDLNKSKREINIWSAACSTGEEAYNLAIIANQALQNYLKQGTGFSSDCMTSSSSWRINILATDLSKQVIRIAETAIYNDSVMGSFRNNYQEILPYFDIDRTEGNNTGSVITYYKVKQNIRSMVKFRQFNLLTDTPPQRNIDLIICRNVLIYFNDANKMQAQHMMDKSLNAGGAIVLGTVDTCYLKHYKQHMKVGCHWFTKPETDTKPQEADSPKQNDPFKRIRGD